MLKVVIPLGSLSHFTIKKIYRNKTISNITKNTKRSRRHMTLYSTPEKKRPKVVDLRDAELLVGFALARNQNTNNKLDFDNKHDNYTQTSVEKDGVNNDNTYVQTDDICTVSREEWSLLQLIKHKNVNRRNLIRSICSGELQNNFDISNNSQNRSSQNTQECETIDITKEPENYSGYLDIMNKILIQSNQNKDLISKFFGFEKAKQNLNGNKNKTVDVTKYIKQVLISIPIDEVVSKVDENTQTLLTIEEKSATSAADHGIEVQDLSKTNSKGTSTSNEHTAEKDTMNNNNQDLHQSQQFQYPNFPNTGLMLSALEITEPGYQQAAGSGHSMNRTTPNTMMSFAATQPSASAQVAPPSPSQQPNVPQETFILPHFSPTSPGINQATLPNDSHNPFRNRWQSEPKIQNHEREKVGPMRGPVLSYQAQLQPRMSRPPLDKYKAWRTRMWQAQAPNNPQYQNWGQNYRQRF